MYSPTVIERRRQALGKHLGFLPERSSPEKIAYLRATLESITEYDSNGNPIGFTETPPPWLCRMRDNEIEMCRLDFLYWCENYAIIRASTDELISFNLNRAQRIMLSVWAELEESGFAIYIINLKSRQLGMSSLIEMAIAHRVQFYPSVKAVVASSDPRKSERMSQMMFLCWQHQPWWLKPSQVTSRAGVYAKFSHGSEIYIEHGSRDSGIARGTTPSVVHLCFAPNTLIHCADGRLKPITEMQVGEEIIAGDGIVSKVKAVAKSGRHNELSSLISVWGNPIPLETTRDHRIMTPTGYREAKDIQKWDFIAHPVRPISREITEIQIKKYKSGEAGKMGRYREIIRPFDQAFGYVCGLYLAEGSVSYNSRLNNKRNIVTTAFSINLDEEAHVTAKLKAGVGETFNVTRSLRKNSKSLVLKVNGSGLAQFFKDNFGSLDGKVVPVWAWTAGDDFCKGLVQGYIEGDGHQRKSGNDITACSIRPSLIFQMRDLVASLGWGWSGITYRKEGFYYKRNCQAIWTMQMSGIVGFNIRTALGYPTIRPTWGEDYGRHWKYSEDKKQVFLEVGSNVEGYCEEFWDLEVDHPDHNFCTVQCGVANSELPDWEKPKELIDSSLMRAIHPDPWKMVILESTAKGIGNWWHQKWKASLRWPRAKFRPVFLPWFTDEYFWPTPTWLLQNPVPRDWQPRPETEAHAERAAMSVATDALLQQHFPAGWTMPRHQQWFYENDKDEHIKEKQLAEFLSEMPANHVEAFQSTAYSIFSVDTIDFHQSRCRAPIAMYGFVGRLIPVHLQPTAYEIDYSYETDLDAPKPIRINVRGTDDPSVSFMVTMVPLIMDDLLSETEPEPPFGKLLIYEYPRVGQTYGFGVDTAEGIGLDRTVIEGYRKGVPGVARNYQTCEFASPYINSVDLVPIMMAIATWYSPMVNGEIQQAKVVIECAGNGETTQLEMKKRGWRNFHEWLRYDNKIIKRSSARKIGWLTRGWSRSMMLDYLIKALKDDWLVISSPWFVEEMKELEKEEGGTKAEACLTPDSFVLTDEFKVESISNLRYDDRIITKKGRSRPVIKMPSREYIGELLEMKISGLPGSLKITPEHKVWGRRRTTKTLQRYVVRKDYPAEWIKATDLKKGDWVSVPKRRGLKQTQFTDGQLYAMGLWLAEGHYILDREKKVSGLGITNTNKAFVDRWLSECSEWFPTNIIGNNQFGGKRKIKTRTYVSCRNRKAGEKDVYDVSFYHREAAEFFLKTFGRGAFGKFIGPEVLNAKGLTALVSGFIDGDGSQRSGQAGDVSLHTISTELAWQLRQILIDSGIWCTISQGKLRGKSRRPLWTINIKSSYLSLLPKCKVVPTQQRLRRMVMEDEYFFYTPITETGSFHYEGPVHNLEIAEDSSYTANGVVVHNCMGAHDDRIMAMAMVNLSMWDLELYSGPLDTRMREFREPLKEYPRLTIPRATGGRYGSPSEFLESEGYGDPAEDEREAVLEYD